MPTAEYTLEQYNALCAAIAQGLTKIEYGDKKLEWRSLDEMERIKAAMEGALKIKKKTNRRYVSQTKGLI